MLGDGIKQAQPSELNTRSVARRSIRAARYIASGETIQLEDLMYQRPGDGLSPMLGSSIVGRITGQTYLPGECIDA